MSRVDNSAAFAPRIGENSPTSGRGRLDPDRNGPGFAEFLPRSPGISGRSAPQRANLAGPAFREDSAFRADTVYAGPERAGAAGAEVFDGDAAGFSDDVAYATESGAAEAGYDAPVGPERKSQFDSTGTIKLEEAAEFHESGTAITGASAPEGSAPAATNVAPNATPATQPVLAATAVTALAALQLLAVDGGEPAETASAPGDAPDPATAPPSPGPAVLTLPLLQAVASASEAQGSAPAPLSGARPARPGPREVDGRAASRADAETRPPGAPPPAGPVNSAQFASLAPGGDAKGISLEGFTPATDKPRGDDALLAVTDPAAGVRGNTGLEAAREATGAAGPPRLNPDSLAGLAARIAKRHEAGNSVFDLRLDPAELGRISVRIEIDSGNRAHAVIAAERPEALAELTRHARTLETSLRQSGVTLADDGLRFQLAGENPDANSGARQGFSTDGQGSGTGRTGAIGRNQRAGDLQFGGADEGLRAAVRRAISGRLDLLA